MCFLLTAIRRFRICRDGGLQRFVKSLIAYVGYRTYLL
jgi:hypothetical protein